jgi:hypothetical protein
MMNKTTLITGILLALVLNIFAQKSDITYFIRANLNTKKHTIAAQSEITFRNNDTSPIDTLMLQLWANAYSDRKSPLAEQMTDLRNEKLHLANKRYGGGYDSIAIKVYGVSARVIPVNGTKEAIYIILEKPLNRGETAQLKIHYQIKLPKAKSGNLGYHKNEYFLCDWYPRIASRIKNRWLIQPLTEQGAPLKQKSDYTVELEIPGSLVSAGSGELQNPDVNKNLSDVARKTLVYKVDKCADFSVFLSPDFIVNKDTVMLRSGRIISIQTYNHPKYSKLWPAGMPVIKSALQYFSNTVCEYPYPQYTVCDGFGYGGKDQSRGALSILMYKKVRVTLDDIQVKLLARQWFGNIIPNDGQQNPQYSDGLSAYYHRRYFTDTRGPGYNGLPIPVLPIMGVKFLRRSDLDHIPWIYKVRNGTHLQGGLETFNYVDSDFGIEARGYNALLYRYLEAWLGRDVFDAMMKEYTHVNSNGSVSLSEFTQQFTGKQADWFFTDLIKEKGIIDYKIMKGRTRLNPKTGKEEMSFVIRNKGDVNAPYPVYVYTNEKQPGKPVWYTGHTGDTVIFPGNQPGESVHIDARGLMPESHRKNNLYRDSVKLHYLEKTRFNFIMGPPDMGNRNQIFYLPVTLWNNYNKSMAGFAIHNKTPVRKPFEFLITPFLSLNPIGFAGVGILSGYIPTNRNRWIEGYSYKLAYTRFAYYFDREARDWNRIMPRMTVFFRPGHPASRRRAQLYVRSIFNLLEADDIYRQQFNVNSLAFNVTEATFFMRDNRLLFPYTLTVTAEYISEFKNGNFGGGHAAKIWAVWYQKINYLAANKSFDIRLFAGTFLGKPNTSLDYRFRMSGHPGYWDYKFDNYFLGRSDTRGLSSRQFFENDGGFKQFTTLGQTDRWMIAANLRASIPGPIPVKPFLDLALYNRSQLNTSGQIERDIAFSYSGGVMLSVINDVLEIYFPLFHSADIRSYINGQNTNWLQHVRFRLNMQELNPKRIKERMEWWPR